MVTSRVSLMAISNLSLANNDIRSGWSNVSYESVGGPKRV